MHIHHILPKHLGGTDDPDNLTPPISVEVHAAFHKDLWENLGHIEDFIAWKALSGRLTSEEARLMAAKAGQDKSEKYKESRKITGNIVKSFATKETRSKGGKTASFTLLQWQKNNIDVFKAQCSKIGKLSAERQKIPHLFKDTYYESKKQLQQENKMSNSKFYKLLNEGVILRLDKHDRTDS